MIGSKMMMMLHLVSLDCEDISMEDVCCSHISSIWVDIDTNNVDIFSICLLVGSTFASFSTTKLTHWFVPP